MKHPLPCTTTALVHNSVVSVFSVRRNIRSLNILVFSIVTYTGFARLIRRVLDFMNEFIGSLYSYNWLQQFTNRYLTNSHLLPTGNCSDFQLNFVVLRCTPSVKSQRLAAGEIYGTNVQPYLHLQFLRKAVCLPGEVQGAGPV